MVRGQRIREAASEWLAYINDSDATDGASERQAFVDAVLAEVSAVASSFGWIAVLDYDGLTSAYYLLCPPDDSDADVVTVRISNHPGTAEISFEVSDTAETHERQLVEIAEAISERISDAE